MTPLLSGKLTSPLHIPSFPSPYKQVVARIPCPFPQPTAARPLTLNERSSDYQATVVRCCPGRISFPTDPRHPTPFYCFWSPRNCPFHYSATTSRREHQGERTASRLNFSWVHTHERKVGDAGIYRPTNSHPSLPQDIKGRQLLRTQDSCTVAARDNPHLQGVPLPAQSTQEGQPQ